MSPTAQPFPQYQILELIHQSDRTVVYRGWRKTDSQPVVIKLMRNNYPSFNELAQFRNQYTIAKTLDIDGIIKPYALERYENRYALIMEDFEGISLEEAIGRAQRRVLTVPQFLPIAIQLVESLHQLHQNCVIHKDIKPANILIHPETQQTKLIDFSISSLLPKETQTLKTPNRLEGTLAYLSPEQTGRMNRGIDYRSDFYSLGVTFYELLSGKRPFESNDPIELVHCHIAKIAEPFENKPEIPNAIANLVMKLMAKNAEDRYQSALGLKHDLEKCLRLWQETGTIEWFELGERDRSDRFLIPEKLYGREREVQTLLASFNRVANPPKSPQGDASQTELILVAGFSGIGKTAVINEVHKPIVRQRGYFIKGKFDQFQRNIPFSAFVQAFRDLMGQLLGESDAQLENWKSEILAALGENGQIIIDVIPELERIIGPQREVVELSGSAAKNRFNLLFQKFIRVFTTPNHPLVIFIDDLQWADSASLKLMQLLMSDLGTGYLLLLGAYRDNEVFPAHPLMLTLDEIAKFGATLNTITLAPLSLGDLNRLVADTLSCQLELALPLTELIHQKTKGNPFFATQFLKGLHEDGWIAFNLDLSYWECDMTGVRELALTDDVVEFMAARLHKLPEKNREILKLAACIGNQFDLATLAMTCEQSKVEVATRLWGALEEGLILPVSDSYKFFQEINYQEQEQSDRLWVSYKFLHDRIQQAAYSLISDTEKTATHLKIGRLLWQSTAVSEREDKLFEIANHLNYGIDLITDIREIDDLSRVNLLAGKKAKNATAYRAAVNYLNQGLKLLPERPWELAYELTLSLHCEAMQSEYLSGNIDSSESLAKRILQHVNNQLDAINVYETKIQIYITSQQTDRAIDTGLDALAIMGISLDEMNERSRQAIALPQTGTVPELLEASDPYHLGKMRILTAITSAALISRPEILFSIVGMQAHLCSDNGYSALAAFSYSWYGALLCVNPTEIKRGYQSGQLAIALLERFRDRATVERCRVYNMVYSFVNPWKKHARESLVYLLEGSQSGLDVGDLVYASYCIENYCVYLFLTGNDLVTVTHKQDMYIELMRKIKNDYAADNISIWRQLNANLSGKSTHVEQLIGEHFDESIAERHWQASQLGWSLFNLYLAKTMLSYYRENWAEAIASAALATSYAISVGAWMPIATNNFYYSLALLANFENGPSASDRAEILARVQANQEILLQWVQNAPMNYQHKWELVEAERQRVLCNKAEAIELYDRAINGAKENGYVQEEALANELAAKFYIKWSKEKIAQTYMQEAYYSYARWGALAKVEDLEKRYPALLATILEQQKLGSTPSTTSPILTNGAVSKTTTGTRGLLDLVTLMKASRTLSENIELESAIANLMQVARENAGAETVALMLFEEQVLMLTAKVGDGEAPKLDSIPVENSNAVPLSIVNQVKHGQQPLLLENASQEAAFAGDAYIQYHQPQSILCLPLVDRGQLIGILYLENNQVTGAFTSDRLDVLKLLCSQAAIALENARLYQQAQQALTDLQHAQLQLVQNEKMATLGNLLAGVAHEINNPIGFIGGNVTAAREHIHDLLNALSLYQQHAFIPSSIAAELEDLDLDFITEDFPKLITSMQMGVERVRQIGISLRNFSRTDTEKKTEFNLHEGLESTLLILKYRLQANERRTAIKIIKEYGDIPEIQCYPGQLNQVFMNLLGNAIDALDESNSGLFDRECEKYSQQIRLQTKQEKNRIIVKISDSGTGMSEEVKARIFEQGFTTKPVGKGTGLGMAIARQIIEEKHGGAIACISELGRGTQFTISLPIG